MNSRRLLTDLGYDPDEGVELTPNVACGAEVIGFIFEYGGYPENSIDLQNILDHANLRLKRAGLEERAGEITLRQVIAEMQGTPKTGIR